MNLTLSEFFAVGAVIFAIFMSGTIQLRTNLLLYAIQTLLVGVVTAAFYLASNESQYLWLALVIILLKAAGISLFLAWVLRRINVFRDGATYLPIPIAMHVCILMLGIAHFLADRLPAPPDQSLHLQAGSAESGIALVLIGTLFMLTRKTAVSQIVGFLTMENGIYLFTLAQAHGMPMAVELGILLDVLVGVMVAGVITFRIQKSFEHIDVTQLRDLRD
ncbi:MAG: hypothetical protein KC652_14600 [Cyanobacteria bacterium HKST-UBA01]|nr:hypothetical protein [Cyanobacteria bacterium HKST-UBA01]